MKYLSDRKTGAILDPAATTCYAPDVAKEARGKLYLAWNVADAICPAKPRVENGVVRQTLTIATFAVASLDRENAMIFHTLPAARFAVGNLDAAIVTKRQLFALLSNQKERTDALKR